MTIFDRIKYFKVYHPIEDYIGYNNKKNPRTLIKCFFTINLFGMGIVLELVVT